MSVDPRLVPSRRLRTGAEMPAIGLGTFGSDRYSPAEVAGAIGGAVEAGYRHFDCAAVYGNEGEVGEVLGAVLSGGIARDELWITSKLWNDRHGEVEQACRRSLRDLRLEHLDLYLVHWPFPNFHPPGCDVDSRSPHARPYVHEEFMRTWRAMEALVDAGLVRHLGTSNVTIPKLERILRDARIPPAVNEMELHPHFQQPELFAFCRAHDVQPVGYCPLGSPSRPERDRTPDDTFALEDPVIARIAAAHDAHPAVICIKWAAQRGQIPIPFAVKPAQYAANLEAVVADPLTGAEMAELAAIDRNCRLIKGQVFLWKPGQSWEDLWDPDGVITPP